jgi:hypothetical protein
MVVVGKSPAARPPGLRAGQVCDVDSDSRAMAAAAAAAAVVDRRVALPDAPLQRVLLGRAPRPNPGRAALDGRADGGHRCGLGNRRHPSAGRSDRVPPTARPRLEGRPTRPVGLRLGLGVAQVRARSFCRPFRHPESARARLRAPGSPGRARQGPARRRELDSVPRETAARSTLARRRKYRLRRAELPAPSAPARSPSTRGGHRLRDRGPRPRRTPTPPVAPLALFMAGRRADPARRGLPSRFLPERPRPARGEEWPARSPSRGASPAEAPQPVAPCEDDLLACPENRRGKAAPRTGGSAGRPQAPISESGSKARRSAALSPARLRVRRRSSAESPSAVLWNLRYQSQMVHPPTPPRPSMPPRKCCCRTIWLTSAR